MTERVTGQPIAARRNSPMSRKTATLEHAGHELLVTYIHLGSASCCSGRGRRLDWSFLAENCGFVA